MTTVQLHRIGKTFGGQPVLDGLDFSAKSGRYVVLLGPSGCGKTTTLRLIAGLESPDRGEIEFDGDSVLRVEPRHRDVAMVFQHDGLYPHLTLEQSLRFGMRKIAKPEIQARVNEAARMVGMEQLLDRYPDKLSGGELRRGAIAKAIVRRTAIRLLDEPLSALDASVRYALQEDILRWHDAFPGTTIHVTHDGREAMRMADEIAVLDRGRIVQSGSPRDVYHDPRSIAVAKAIGTPPMNFVPAALADNMLHFAGPDMESNLNRRLDCEGSVLVGIRPESIQLQSRQNQCAGISWVSTVTDRRQVESCFQLKLSLRQAGQTICAVVTDRRLEQMPQNGERVECHVAAEDLRIFLKHDGRRIDAT